MSTCKHYHPAANATAGAANLVDFSSRPGKPQDRVHALPRTLGRVKLPRKVGTARTWPWRAVESDGAQTGTTQFRRRQGQFAVDEVTAVWPESRCTTK